MTRHTLEAPNWVLQEILIFALFYFSLTLCNITYLLRHAFAFTYVRMNIFETITCKKLQIKLPMLLSTLGMLCQHILLLLRILMRDFLCKPFGVLAFVHPHGQIKLPHHLNSEKVF